MVTTDAALDMAVRRIDEMVHGAVRDRATIHTDRIVVRIRDEIAGLDLSSAALTRLVIERAAAAGATLRIETPLEILGGPEPPAEKA